MAKHNRASNLGKFLHPKKSGGKKVSHETKSAPVSVGAFDVGDSKKSSRNKK